MEQEQQQTEIPPLVIAALNCDFGEVTDILSSNADVNAKDHLGRTALHAAASTGLYETVEKLIDAGADVNARDADWLTPMHMASSSHNPAIIDLLAARGADVNARTKRYQTPLHVATACGDEDVVRKLLEHHLIVNVPDRARQSPLHFAAYSGFESVCRLLVDNGADVKALDRTKRSAAFLAALRGHHGIVRWLLDDQDTLTQSLALHDTEGYTLLHAAAVSGCITTFVISKPLNIGFDVNATCNSGMTPLHIAAINGNVILSQALLESGCIIDIQDSQNQTPLHKACALGFQEVVEILISSDASVLKKDIRGRLPMHLACNNGDVGCIENILLTNAETLNEGDNDGNTPIHFAAHQGDSQLLDLLEDNGGKLDFFNANKRLPLHIAARRGNASAVSFFANKLPHFLDARDEHGQTPMHAAAFAGNIDCVMILANNNAKCDLLDKFERTPLHYAAAVASTSVIDTLIQKMARPLKLKVDCNKRSALHLAAAADSIGEAVALLVRDGLAITQIDSTKVTPLHIAVLYSHKLAFDFMLDALPRASLSAIVNSTEQNGRTPLHFAAYSGNSSILEAILNIASIQLDPIDNNGFTPLHFAALRGHKECVQLLMDRTAKANAVDVESRTPLMLAAAKGHKDIIEIMLFDEDFDTDVNMTDMNGCTAFMYACRSNEIESINGIMSADPPPDLLKRDVNGIGAAHICAEKGNHTVLKQLLETADETFFICDNLGRTPAHFAAINGQEESLKVILSVITDATVDNFGHTPLHYAAYHGHEGCLSLLLDRITSVHTEEESLFGPLHCACIQGHYGCLDLLLEEAQEIVRSYTLKSNAEALIFETLDVNSEDNFGRTPLHIAAAAGFIECTLSLVAIGADIDKRLPNMRTALMLAASKGHHNVVEALLNDDLETKANPFVQDEFGQCTLHMAMLPTSNVACAEAIVQAAIKLGPGLINLQNNRGETPLHLAAAQFYSNVVTLLLDAGADARIKDENGYSPIFRLLPSSEARACLAALLCHQ